MIKNISRLECFVNEKPYHLLCDMDSPIECVEEALRQFQIYLDKIKESIEQQKQEAENVPQEEAEIVSISQEAS